MLIGGLGGVGQEVANLLIKDGFNVIGVRRTVQKGAKESTVTVVAGDLTEPGALAGIAACTYVVYCVAASKHDEAAYHRAYVQGLTRTIAQVKAWPQPWPKFLFTSSTGVYGQDDGSVVTETSPTEPKGFSGRVMLEAEKVLRSSGLEHVVLRLSGIYGPGRDRLMRQVRQGGWDEGEQRDEFLNRIHQVDAARAIVHLLCDANLAGVFVGSDVEPALRSEVLGWVAQKLRQLGENVPALPTFSREAPGNKRCSSEKLQATGFTFAYPTYRQGF